MSEAPAKSDKPAKKPLVPPEETFWQRYSAHHEAPLSGVSSLALHLLAIPLILLVGWLIIKLGLGEDTKPVSVEPVVISGGGGSRFGSDGSGSDPGSEVQKDGERGDPKGNPSNQVTDLEQRKPLDPVKAQSMLTQFDNDENVQRWVNDPTQQFKRLADRERDTREQLRKASNPGKGQGGAGKDGGKDTGKDKGTGGDLGEGNAKLSDRERRQMRWHITFNTLNGQDYASQLQDFGATIAIPTKEKGIFRVIEKPAAKSPQVETRAINNMDQIFWVDDEERSIISLMQALGLKEKPEYFAAFFPPDFEKRLLTLELDYQEKKTGKRDEGAIDRTKFNVIKKGATYDVSVANQEPLKKKK